MNTIAIGVYIYISTVNNITIYNSHEILNSEYITNANLLSSIKTIDAFIFVGDELNNHTGSRYDDNSATCVSPVSIKIILVVMNSNSIFVYF